MVVKLVCHTKGRKQVESENRVLRIFGTKRNEVIGEMRKLYDRASHNS
jgi:hypothetical protein